jgi:hypothetical protein
MCLALPRTSARSSPLRPLAAERQGEVGRSRKYGRTKEPTIQTALTTPPQPNLSAPEGRRGKDVGGFGVGELNAGP